MKSRTRHSQVCLRHPQWLPHQTLVRVLLALEQTLLFDHHLLNTRTPVLFLLAQGQTLELDRLLLVAPVWPILCLGPMWQTLWHRQQQPRVGEPSHPLWGGNSQACPQCPLPLMWTHLLMQCV